MHTSIPNDKKSRMRREHADRNNKNENPHLSQLQIEKKQSALVCTLRSKQTNLFCLNLQIENKQTSLV